MGNFLQTARTICVEPSLYLDLSLFMLHLQNCAQAPGSHEVYSSILLSSTILFDKFTKALIHDVGLGCFLWFSDWTFKNCPTNTPPHGRPGKALINSPFTSILHFQNNSYHCYTKRTRHMPVSFLHARTDDHFYHVTQSLNGSSGKCYR